MTRIRLSVGIGQQSYGPMRITFDPQMATLHASPPVEEPVIVLAHDRNNGHLRLHREVERALLEWQELRFGRGRPGAFGEDPQGELRAKASAIRASTGQQNYWLPMTPSRLTPFFFMSSPAFSSAATAFLRFFRSTMTAPERVTREVGVSSPSEHPALGREMNARTHGTGRAGDSTAIRASP